MSARRKVELVDAMRVALGKCEMPREWIESVGGSAVEKALWRTDEVLRYPPPDEPSR